FPAASHEQALDKLTMEVQQLDEHIDRALTLAPATPPGVSTQLPTPESNKLIGWNQDADALQNIDSATLATIVAYGTAKADIFSGNGVTKNFSLSANPGAQANLDVIISGVGQRAGIDYTWSAGTTVSFVTAPPTGTNNIQVRYFQGLPQGFSYGAATSFSQAGAGAVPRTAQDKLRETVSLEDFGAIGNGVADDTTAFQSALNTGKLVWAQPGKTYYCASGISMSIVGQELELRGATLKTAVVNILADNVEIDLGGGTIAGLLHKGKVASPAAVGQKTITFVDASEFVVGD